MMVKGRQHTMATNISGQLWRTAQHRCRPADRLCFPFWPPQRLEWAKGATNMIKHSWHVVVLVLLALTLHGCHGDDTPQAQANPAPQPNTPDRATHEGHDLYAMQVRRIAGDPVSLDAYRGQVLLIVNTASRCGHTRQYADLQKLHETYGDQGLAVLGFPANDFGNQEPGSNEEIASFCQVNFGVTFDLFEKITVKGDEQHPLYAMLTEEPFNTTSPGPVRWNFEKFLISRDGKLLARFGSSVSPSSPQVIEQIQAALAAG